jgi:hypothetical protein
LQEYRTRKGLALIYAAFSIYLLGIYFAGQGIYRLWADVVKPRWLGWALLPGTVVSQMAYIFGCLITGGEVRRAKLMDGGDRRRGGGGEDGEPATEATEGVRFLGPAVAAFMSIVACGAGIVVAHSLLGEPVIREFIGLGRTELPKAPPTSLNQFWDQLTAHLHLLRRMAEVLPELNWRDFRVPLFVYLTICLLIRLAPVRKSLRATLAAVLLLAGLIALVGLIWDRFDGLLRNDLWPLVTYLWSLLLLLLAVTLIFRGLVGLVRGLMTPESGGGGGGKSRE